MIPPKMPETFSLQVETEKASCEKLALPRSLTLTVHTRQGKPGAPGSWELNLSVEGWVEWGCACALTHVDEDAECSKSGNSS